MRQEDGKLTLSATDLVIFLGCRRATFLDLKQLAEGTEPPSFDQATQLLLEKGLEHERRYVAELQAGVAAVVESASELPASERMALTKDAMAAGAEIIYQGGLVGSPWQGYSDFLSRVEVSSGLGSWSYEVSDTKLSRTAKPYHAIQITLYSDTKRLTSVGNGGQRIFTHNLDATTADTAVSSLEALVV